MAKGNILLMAYTILHETPPVRLTHVHHQRRTRPVHTRGLWTGPIRQKYWTLDYCGWEGSWVDVEHPPGTRAAHPRPSGTWHLYAPGVAYHERYDKPENRREDMWLFFTLEATHPFFERHRFARIADPESVLPPIVRRMFALQQRGEPGRENLLHAYLLAILGHVVLAAREGAGTPADPWRLRDPESAAAAGAGALLEQVDAAVSRTLSEPPSLDELAAELGLSVSSLAHRFKAETGITVVDRVRWLRIRESRRLLARPNTTVKSVARELGFSSPFYFSRVFREVEGITPLEYLKRQLRR